MSENRVLTCLERMRAACRRAMDYVSQMSQDDFHRDNRTQDAVIANIAAIGECAITIMDSFPEFANDHAEIPWQDIRAMRNRLAHQYFEVDTDTAWLTVTIRIPELLRDVSAIIDWHVQGE